MNSTSKIGLVFILYLSTLLVLLGIQAEPVTAGFAFVTAAILVLAIVLAWKKLD